MTPLLRVEGLTKRFGKLAAVDGVSLQVPEGRLTAIIGPNGAGKTTFINLLTGAVYPDSGAVWFKGENLTYMPPEERVKRGMARTFQIMSLFPSLAVEQNVLLPVLARLSRTARFLTPAQSERTAVREAEEVLHRVGLWSQRYRAAGSLSHGDQRLLEVGMALASRPSLCLLDEPTSGMNPAERVAVLNLIRELSASLTTTFIIVEHDMDVVFSLAEWIVVMNRGQVLAEGSPQEIRSNKQVKEAYLGEDDIP